MNCASGSSLVIIHNIRPNNRYECFAYWSITISNERILRGVQSRAEVDAAVARAVGLQDKPDAVLLAWAAAEDRIVVSHDLETMPRFAIARVRGGETMPGLILVPQELQIGRAIEELTMVASCSDQREWRDMIVYIPL